MAAHQDKAKMQQMMQEQRQAMEDHKWILGEKLGHDPGQECLLEWVKLHGPMFREYWEKANGKIFS